MIDIVKLLSLTIHLLQFFLPLTFQTNISSYAYFKIHFLIMLMFWFYILYVRQKKYISRQKKEKKIAVQVHTFLYILWSDCMKFSIKSSVKRRTAFTLPIFCLSYFSAFYYLSNDRDIIRVHSFKLIRIVKAQMKINIQKNRQTDITCHFLVI